MSLITSLISKASRDVTNVRSKYKGLPHLLKFAPHHHHHHHHLHVTVTSKEMIKPSSPTPRHLNTVQLSLVDQMQSSYHVPVILFYQNDTPNHSVIRSMALKKSLSETLVRFYPLAGRFKGNESVSCEDQGVEFCEANVSEQVSNVINNPNLEELRALLPFQTEPSHKDSVLSIQLNNFSCGGTGISLRLSHKIADGASMTAFLNAWADVARAQTRGIADEAWPKFNGASIFPPLKELADIHPGDEHKYNAEKILSRRLTFDKEKIKELKAAAVGSPSSSPSSVEVVTAFIWKRFLMADPTSKITSVMHAVSCRTRMVPPVPEGSFGNFTCPTRTPPLTNGRNTEFPELVHSIRKAINKVDDVYLTRLLKGDQRWVEINKERDNFAFGDDRCFFSSLRRCPFYDVDFGLGLGLGKPVWACFTTFPVSNMVMLFGTSCRNGVEAWIHMRQHDINAIDFYQ